MIYNKEVLFDELKKLNYSNCYILCNTKNNQKTLKIINKNHEFYLHSKYDPIKEAKRFAEKNYVKNKDIFIYGLGLGYHIEEIYKKLDHNQNLYVLECNMEIIKYFMDNFKSAEFISSDKVILCGSNDINTIKRFIYSTSKNSFILYYEPSVKAIPKELEYIKRFIINLKLDKNSKSKENLKQMKINHDINSNAKLPNALKLLENKCCDIPAIVISGGPSLLQDINYIKDITKNAIIISVGRNTNILKEHNIDPTFWIEIEHRHLIADRFKNLNSKAPLIMLSTSSHKLITSYKGSKAMIYTRDHPSDTQVVEGGISTVAATALNFILLLGCNPVYIVGQDLCYRGEWSHADKKDVINYKAMPTVKCVDNIFRYTSDGLLRHKTSIENIIRKFPYKKIINCTSKGAVIEGSSYMHIEKLKDKLKNDLTYKQKELINIIENYNYNVKAGRI